MEWRIGACRELYVADPQCTHHVDGNFGHPQKAGARWCQRQRTRLDERAMARRTSRWVSFASALSVCEPDGRRRCRAITSLILAVPEDLPMAPNSSRPHSTAVLLADEQDLLRSATCPLCHTSATLTQSAIEAGGAWRCVMCGQRWDAARLATVAAYAAWAAEHDRVGRRGADDSHDTAPYRDSSTERPRGRP